MIRFKILRTLLLATMLIVAAQNSVAAWSSLPYSVDVYNLTGHDIYNLRVVWNDNFMTHFGTVEEGEYVTIYHHEKITKVGVIYNLTETLELKRDKIFLFRGRANIR